MTYPEEVDLDFLEYGGLITTAGAWRVWYLYTSILNHPLSGGPGHYENQYIIVSFSPAHIIAEQIDVLLTAEYIHAKN